MVKQLCYLVSQPKGAVHPWSPKMCEVVNSMPRSIWLPMVLVPMTPRLGKPA